MTARAQVYRALVVGCVSLSGIACAPSAVYVGVAVPGPYYGPYPYPVRPGVWGRPPYVCCYDEDGAASAPPSPHASADSTSWRLATGHWLLATRKKWPVISRQ